MWGNFFLRSISVIVVAIVQLVWTNDHAYGQNSLTAQSASNSPNRVVYFVLEMESDSAWRAQINNVLEDADRLLDLDIEVVRMPYVRNEIVEQVKERVTAKPEFSHAIISNNLGEGRDVIDLLVKADIQPILIHKGFEFSDQDVTSEPNSLAPIFIIPDDEEGGYQLSEKLINAARINRLRGARLKLFALSGSRLDQSSIARVQGMRRSLEKQSDVDLIHLSSARWSKTIAEQKIGGMISRYGPPDIIWCANDDMALGAVKALQVQGQLFQNVHIGGFDWAPEVVELIEDRVMSATMGGHHYDLFLALLIAEMNYFAANGSVFINSHLSSLDHANSQQLSDLSLAHLDFETRKTLINRSISHGFSLNELAALTHKDEAP